MFFSVSSIFVVATVLVSLTISCLARDGCNNANQRIARQAADTNTNSDEMEGGCALPPPLDHGRFNPSQKKCPGTSSSLACQMITGTIVPSDWVIFHSCIPGYKLQNGTTFSVCAKGKWVPPLPQCVADGCYLPEQPTQGSYEVANPNPCRPDQVGLDACWNTPGTLVPSSWTIKYKCSTYNLPNTTSYLSSCVNGSWTNPVGCVEKPAGKCSPLKYLSFDVYCQKDGRNVSCDSVMKPETVATLQCKPFYTSSEPGTDRVFCLKNGDWTVNKKWCSPVCGIQQGPLTLNSPITQGNFPWLAALYKRNKETWEFVHKCSGTLITPHIILTAVHCVMDKRDNLPVDPRDLKIGLGKSYSNYSGLSKVETVIVPGKYVYGWDPVNYTLDIALLDLVRSVEVTAFVMPACFSLPETLKPEPHANGTVAMWGVTERSEPSDVIIATNMTFISYDECLKSLPAHQKQLLTHDKFCTTRINGGEPENDDSGAGLTLVNQGKHYVVGILSIQINNISIYTNVTRTEYSLYIKDQISSLGVNHFYDEFL